MMREIERTRPGEPLLPPSDALKFCAAAALYALVLAGCGDSSATTNTNLKALANAYRVVLEERNQRPQTWEDLETAGLKTHSRQQLVAQRYMVEFGYNYQAMEVG